jgi:hypothetical protein
MGLCMHFLLSCDCSAVRRAPDRAWCECLWSCVDTCKSPLHPLNVISYRLGRKRYDRRLVGFLTREEIEALLDAPNLQTWDERRDRAFVMMGSGVRIPLAAPGRRFFAAPAVTCGICRPFQILSGPKDGSKVGSIYQLSKLKRMPSGAWKGRKAIPQAVRVEYQRLYGPGVEFWSPAGTAAREAKAEYAEWQALIERRATALRESGAGGRDLTQRQAHALAGEWYRWFVRLHEDNPGACSHWAEVHEVWWNSLPLLMRPVTPRLGKSTCAHLLAVA